MNEKTIEVRAQQPLIHLIGDFQKMEGVLDVYTAGEYLHITTGTAEKVAACIAAYARKKGLQTAVSEVTPSLEDVFVNLTRTMKS